MNNIKSQKNKLMNLKKALLLTGMITTIGATACSKGKKEEVQYIAPAGYTLEQDENGNTMAVKYSYVMVQATTLEIIDKDGNKEVQYVVPDGFELRMNADESGKVTMVGVKLEKIYTLPLVEPKREEKTKTR